MAQILHGKIIFTRSQLTTQRVPSAGDIPNDADTGRHNCQVATISQQSALLLTSKCLPLPSSFTETLSLFFKALFLKLRFMDHL